MKEIIKEIIESFQLWPRWLQFGTLAAFCSTPAVITFLIPSFICGIFPEGFLVPAGILEVLIFGREGIPSAGMGPVFRNIFFAIYTIEFWFVTDAFLGRYVKNLFYSAVIVFLIMFCGMFILILLAYG